MRRTILLVSCLGLAGWLAGCVYDAPPEAELIAPENNAFLQAMDVALDGSA